MAYAKARKMYNPCLKKGTNKKFDQLANKKGMVRGSKEYNDYIWGEIAKIEKQIGPKAFSAFMQRATQDLINGVKY